jgi:hypothetical protein
VIEIIRLMLKFEEADRPSFIEMSKLVLTSTDNSIDSPKNQSTKNPLSHKPSQSSAKPMTINPKSKAFSHQ